MVKNLEDSTTYYPTHIGIVPMSWCPVCGKMIPLVEERDPDFISNTMKKRIAHRCATVYKRGYREFKNIVDKKLDQVKDKEHFINRFAVEAGLSQDQVLICCN